MSKLILWVIPNLDFITHYSSEEKIHKGVWSLFADHKSKRPYIFRVVTGKKITVVSIRSSIAPEKVPAVGTIEVMEESALKTDTLYALSVTVNPIVEKTIDGKSKRIPLVTPESIAAWTTTRLEKNGFSVQASATGVPAITCSPAIRKYMIDRGNFYITTSNVQAIVSVQDLDKAERIFAQGIGKEKAFGCGMLSLVPVGDMRHSVSDERDEEND
jgi:CRISPR-associated protein Cas6/Cse3/CasE subtype I-E